MRKIRLMAWVLLVAAALAWRAVLATPDPPAFAEPVVLSSEDGVLEVTLTARQGVGKLDTAAAPVENMMLFSYELAKGKASNGQRAGRDLYPGPTLNVQPGETLVVHLRNDLMALSIRDFFDPAYTPVGKDVPKSPAILREAPFNLHTHGLHVSPMGNSDNVLLNLPGGGRNTYSFQIPADHAQGMYWYHGHLHTLTTAQTYYGLSGLLIIGRADGNLPAVTRANLPIRSMALQYNVVFDRKGGRHQMNNPNWSQFVSTLQPPRPGELESGAYEPSLAPVNLRDSAPGTRFVTNWYSGPLSADNHRGQVMAMPNNLLDFTSDSLDLPADPTLPDSQRDVQFTVNGLFQPEIRSRPGQTEIWVLANISDLAYMRVRLTETATGKHPPLLVVGQDGLPYPKVLTPEEEGPSVLTIPPASRYAIAVTIPEQGDLVLEMPPATNLPPADATKQPFKGPGVAYTSRGQEPPTAVLGTLNVNPAYISYYDGFFVFPTQVLLRANGGAGGAGTTVAFAPGQDLGAPTHFLDAQGEPAVRRNLVINGGFLDEKVSKQDPKAFIYAFDGRAFPNTALMRSRLDSVEEWSFQNYNNDEHPIHIHVNDFQVTELADPAVKFQTGLQNYGQDNVNVPAPEMGAEEAVLAPGTMSFRTRFEDFLGTYVIHCHRLNHEDNGLMAMVNVIPAVSTYAVAADGSVQVRDGRGDEVLATVEPFPGYRGPLSLAMGDVDGDTVLDLVAGTGPGVPARVAALSGAGAKPFSKVLARFAPFEEGFTGGVSVAAGNLDANPMRDNLVVGSGPGRESRVRVFSSRLSPPGTTPAVFHEFSPYSSRNGVSVAVGMVEPHSGRNSLVTAPGPGQPAIVRVFRYDLETELCAPEGGATKIAEFAAFDAGYQGGVTLAVDWLSADVGGAQMIVVGQRAAPGEVRVYSSGSALEGYPDMYTESPVGHGETVAFQPVARFAPFPGGQGVGVATTSTTAGADLLVGGSGGEVRKYRLGRAQAKDTTLTPKLVTQVASSGGRHGGVGGD